MAKNLLKANYKLSVFDMQKSVVNEFAQLGARPSTSPRDAAEGADVVVTMVPSSPHVRQVYSTPSTGILSASSVELFVLKKMNKFRRHLFPFLTFRLLLNTRLSSFLFSFIS